ncbi:MAG: Trm112 family protein [Litorivicinus sp.]
MIDPNVLALLMCPISGGPLTYNPLTESLDSADAGVRFPIIDGIPHLLESAAQPLG